MKNFMLNRSLARIGFALLIITLLFMISMVSIAQTEEKVFRLPSVAGMDNLDPRVYMANQNVVQTSIFEPLVRIRNGDVFPGLAETWEISDDGLTYTFHLRDAKWSDGKPITAGDFVHAFVRMFEICPASQNLDTIENGPELRAGECSPEQLGAKALDDKTLVMTLRGPTPYFLSQMDYYGYPGREDLVEKYGDEYGASVETLASCGPFILKEWMHEDKLILEKNPDYWNKDEIKLDKIIVYILPEHQTRRNMFDNGEIDYYLPISNTEGLEYKDKGMLTTIDKALVRDITINKHGQNDPVKAAILSNNNFKKAISYALDRQGFIEQVLGGKGSPATVHAPPAVSIYPGTTWAEESTNIGKYHPVTADLAKSKEYMDKALEELGYTSVDEFPEFDFLTSESFDDPKALTPYWVSVMMDLGLKIKVKPATGADFWNALYKPALAFDFARSGWGGAYDDPMTFMWYWNSESKDKGVTFESKEYDAFLEKANQERDVKKRAGYINQAETLFADTAPSIPFMYDKLYLAVQLWVKGIETSTYGLCYKHIYADIVK